MEAGAAALLPTRASLPALLLGSKLLQPWVPPWTFIYIYFVPACEHRGVQDKQRGGGNGWAEGPAASGRAWPAVPPAGARRRPRWFHGAAQRNPAPRSHVRVLSPGCRDLGCSRTLLARGQQVYLPFQRFARPIFHSTANLVLNKSPGAPPSCADDGPLAGRLQPPRASQRWDGRPVLQAGKMLIGCRHDQSPCMSYTGVMGV